jgi:hypothetical protein
MGKSRDTANLVSYLNLSVDITNDRVGIGSTVPSQKLDVTGNVRVVGIVTATSFEGSGANLTGIVNTLDTMLFG